MMVKNNQIWENTSKVIKFEENNGGMRAIIFKIKSTGLQFDSIICSNNEDLEKLLKRMRMYLTEKTLTIESL